MEDYVTYEQAVKLKELGFDWECLYYYQNKELCANTQEFAYEEEVSINTNDLLVSHNIDYPNSIYSAPTLSQVAKWLREKGIIISIIPECTAANTFKARLYDSSHRELFIRKITDGLGYHKSYELALSVGIDAALKLIERK